MKVNIKAYPFAYEYIGFISNIFEELGNHVSVNKEKPNIVIFTGGEDVSPSFYGHKNLSSYVNSERDIMEKKLFVENSDPSILKVGICRGAQFLNVMNGGTLVQDLKNHTREHNVYTKTGSFVISSTHHQMMVPTKEAVIIATTPKMGVKYVYDGNPKDLPNEDIEIVYYPQTNSLCIQGHPEFRTCHISGKRFCANLISDIFINGKDKIIQTYSGIEAPKSLQPKIKKEGSSTEFVPVPFNN